ncbi:MAG: GspE/PulE family protein, partial [bacterium]|nr:GspE/PulE family protein [bacterium]
QGLIDLLVSEKIVDTEYITRLLAGSLGVDIANFGTRKINEDVLRLLPENIAREREAILFDREEDGTLDVALADPSDLEGVEFLKKYLKARVKLFLALDADLQRGYSVYGLKSAADFKTVIEENVRASLQSRAEKAEEAAAELPIVSMVENILSYAESLRASDIHIEVLEEAMIVRYRIDGILYEMMRIPKTVHAPLVARFKILAGLKLDEHQKPQDGRFRYQIASQTVDVRVSIMPTYHGEKVEMRLLEASQKPLSLEEVGMLPKAAQTVGENLKRTYGMILICGPTGSGKTTTLYAIMNMLNRPNVNICTIEDPIEYNMRYVNQSQINVQAGITFASGLRALLRQDPNIIMVGEIRDTETANIAVQAALTGHLLLSSLHTNDAPTTVPRLFELEIAPFLLGSTLNLIVAQRLVRRICRSCIYSYDPQPEIRAVIIKQLAELNTSNSEGLIPKIFYRGKGCSSCGDSGYRGRLGIFELLNVTDTIRKIILDPQFNLDTLREKMREEGGATMFEDGLEKVNLGITTIEEVLRVIRE